MAKPYQIPDFRKLYPDASEEIIAVLRVTERKMQYQEYDLKADRTVIDQKRQMVTVIPSREDSYERLLEQNVQFVEETIGTEEAAIQNIQFQQLYKAISLLSEGERQIILQLYFEDCTEREVAVLQSCSQNAVNKRKQRILDKLRSLMKKN